MARSCGCNSATCSCAVTGGSGATVTGVGSTTNPYVVSVDAGHLNVQNTSTVDLSLSGLGTTATPHVLKADAHITLDELDNVVAPAPATGNVLGWDGTQWKPVPPAVTAPGAISVGNCLAGDGSGASPLDTKLDPAGLLACGPSGLGIGPGTRDQLRRGNLPAIYEWSRPSTDSWVGRGNMMSGWVDRPAGQYLVTLNLEAAFCPAGNGSWELIINGTRHIQYNFWSGCTAGQMWNWNFAFNHPGGAWQTEIWLNAPGGSTGTVWALSTRFQIVANSIN